MEDIRNTGQAETPEDIHGAETAEEAATGPVTETVPEELTGEEKKKQKKAERKARRAARNGVSFILVVLIIISINAFWLEFIRYHVVPEYQAQIEEILAEKDEAIHRIQAIYKVREEDFEKRLTACEEKQAELEDMYRKAVKIIRKYGGDLSFLDEETEEETTP